MHEIAYQYVINSGTVKGYARVTEENIAAAIREILIEYATQGIPETLKLAVAPMVS